jgi:hypothetical protein
MRRIISSKTDIAVYVADVFPEMEDADRDEMVEAIQYDEDRPDYGDDWTEWLDEFSREYCPLT